VDRKVFRKPPQSHIQNRWVQFARNNELMNQEEIWQFIAITGAVVLITGLLLTVGNIIQNDVYDLVYDLITLITSASVLLWIKKKILLIGYIFFIISYNIQLIQNTILGFENTSLNGEYLSWINISFLYDRIHIVPNWIFHSNQLYES
jgi:hypothetical protein